MYDEQMKQAIMVKEIFEERDAELKISIEHHKLMKDISTNEKNKLRYDILIAELELAQEFIKDRLKITKKVLYISDKIKSDETPFDEKMDYIMELIRIINNL